MLPGDTFNLLYGEKRPDGRVVTHKVLSRPIDRAMHITSAVVVQTDDGELGLEAGGLGGFFGKKKGGEPSQ